MNLFASKVTFQNEIVIHQPVQQVFAFLQNFENVPQWNYYVVSVKKTSPGQIAAGTTFHQVRKNDSQDYKIVALEPGKLIVAETKVFTRKLERSFVLGAEGNSTRLRDEWVIHIPFLLSPFIGKIKQAVAENLGKLKTLLETGQVSLQDGRLVKLS